MLGKILKLFVGDKSKKDLKLINPIIEEIHSFIKEELKNKSNSSNYISVVYGGSVNLANCKEIYSSDKVDGLLIGGASLDSDTFTNIYNIS